MVHTSHVLLWIQWNAPLRGKLVEKVFPVAFALLLVALFIYCAGNNATNLPFLFFTKSSEKESKRGKRMQINATIMAIGWRYCWEWGGRGSKMESENPLISFLQEGSNQTRLQLQPSLLHQNSRKAGFFLYAHFWYTYPFTWCCCILYIFCGMVHVRVS